MEATVRREETMADSVYGVKGHAEGDRSGGERSEPERRSPSRTSFGGSATVESELPDPEVPAKASRRRFSAAYKKKILEETGLLDIIFLLRNFGLGINMPSNSISQIDPIHGLSKSGGKAWIQI